MASEIIFQLRVTTKFRRLSKGLRRVWLGWVCQIRTLASNRYPSTSVIVRGYEFDIIEPHLTSLNPAEPADNRLHE